MPLEAAWPVPFILEPHYLEVASATAFCISVLLAVLVNAEGQAFAATILGDARQSPKDRFHFNAFLHLSLLGTICYLVGGFGWPRTIDVDPGKFKHPRTYLVITRFAGPIFNLLLASIVATLASLVKILNYSPRVLLMVIGVSVTTAVFNLIILPPLAGGFLIQALLPARFATGKRIFLQAGPFLILALALLDRLQPQGLVSPYLNPLVRAIYHYLLG